jgi:hypothetical protein
MTINEYRVVTSWNVSASAEELARIVSHPEDLTHWWPAVFLRAQPLGDSREFHVGSVVTFETKGWLPYTLTFQGCVQELVYPRKCIVLVWGDFEGQLHCEVLEDGPRCKIRFDWRVRVEKPLVRRLSFLLKPLFYSNHLWVMVRGWQSLKIELARRRLRESGDLYRGVAPPQPTFPYGPRYRWLRSFVLQCLNERSVYRQLRWPQGRKERRAENHRH